MNVLKKLFASFLLISSCIALSCATASAEQIYNGDFIKYKYTLYEDQNVQTDTDYANIAVDPLPGKTEISFDFSVNSVSDSKAGVKFIAQKFSSGKNITLMSVLFKKSSGKISVETKNALGSSLTIADSIETGKTYSVVVQLDLNKWTYNAALYENHEKTRLIMYKRGVEIGSEYVSCGFKGISFNTETSSDINTSYIGVYRERLAENTPVTDALNQVASVGSVISDNISAGEAYDVYAAFYSSDRSKLVSLEKKSYTYSGFDNYVEAVFPWSENFKNGCSMSVMIFRQNDIYPLSSKESEEFSGGNVLPQNFLAYMGFESDVTYVSSSKVTGGTLPEGWSAGGWSGPQSPYSINITSNDSGGYLSIGATDSGYAGIMSPRISVPENGISVTFDVKAPKDYEGNFPRTVIFYYDKDGSYISSDYKIYRDFTPGVWRSEQWCISPENYAAGAAKFSIAFCTTRNGKSTLDSDGKLYYDSIKIDDLTFSMVCEDELSWYSSGSTVTYKPKYPLPDKISKIYGAVYNSDGRLLDVKSYDADYISDAGWQYTPGNSGFYKVIFYGLTSDNRTVNEFQQYKAYYDSSTGIVHYIERPCHDFYVSAFKNKDFGERNKLYGMSIANYDGKYDLDIADRLGMSFLRLHSISWKDIEPENVEDGNGKSYNWEKYDYIFNRIRNEGLKFDVIGNILFTPKWASPNSSTSGSLVPMYASYAPTDMKYLTDFIDDLYERYGDCIDTWEIYNEPHLPGGSVFWHDTAGNYVNMLKAAYNELKSLSADNDTVVMGGIGARRYLSFYRQFLEKGGNSYTDKLPMHGYDIDPWNYLNLNSQLGEDAKGVINTEAHMILFNGSSTNIYYTEKQLALRMLEEYLRQIKYGVEQIAFFQPYDNHIQGEDIKILDNLVEDWDVVNAGIYRQKPNFEPRFSAGVLNTLIAMSGSSISYCDEFESGNVNIVKLKSDGKPLYVLWCDGLAEMSGADISGLGTEAEITDWEGRSVANDNFRICADEVYFVSGLGEDAFNYLLSAQGDEEYNGGVLYCENEINKKTSSGPSVVSSKSQLFDHNTGSIVCSDETASWNDITLSSGKNLSGKLALYSDDNGVEFVIKVNNISSVELTKAQLVIGVDTFANGIYSDVVELTAQMVKGACAVIKTFTPDISGDIPSEDYSLKGETAKGVTAFVTDGDDCSYYCIYVPYIQLYPYFYQSGGSMNFGVKFVGYNSSGYEVTRYITGEQYSPYSPWLFAKTTFYNLNSYKDTVNIDVKAEPGEYVSAKILKDGENVYYNQYIAESDGKCTVTAKLDADGTYVLKTYSKSEGYGVYEFKYTCASE